MESVIELTTREEFERFKKYKRGVIFYGAKWCEGCKKLAPLYERIALKYHKYVKLAHVDIDVAKLDFSSVPVFVAYYKGQQINSLEGATVLELKAFIKAAIETK
jgi:thioredoxin-like negative regulator of GroEL